MRRQVLRRAPVISLPGKDRNQRQRPVRGVASLARQEALDVPVIPVEDHRSRDEGSLDAVLAGLGMEPLNPEAGLTVSPTVKYI